MDKYEFKLKVDEMKALVSARNYNAAAEIAETVNWRKIRNLNALVLAGEVFEQVGRYEESKEILLMAYDKSPIGRNIIYRLAEIAVKTKNFEEAQEYYEEFVDIAPHDNLKFVLKYKMTAAQGRPFQEQIQILEELKEQEYSEEWAYELAFLYHRAGQPDKCVEACDELILWFGDGIYVEKALELKMHYQPLSKAQEDKYRLFRQKRTGVIEVRPNEFLESGEIVNEPVEIPSVQANTGQYNTANLQEEIAKGLQQIAENDGAEKGTNPLLAKLSRKPGNPAGRPPHGLGGLLGRPQGAASMPARPQGQGQMAQEPQRIGGVAQNPNDRDYPPHSYEDAGRPIGYQPGSQPGGYQSNVQPAGDKPVIQPQASQPELVNSMSIEEIQAEWEKTKIAMQEAIREAKRRDLDAAGRPEEIRQEEEAQITAGETSLAEAENLMERLFGLVSQMSAVMPPEEAGQEYAHGMEMPGQQPIEVQEGLEEAGKIVAVMNQLLQEQIEQLSAENGQAAVHRVSDPTREMPKLPEYARKDGMGVAQPEGSVAADDTEDLRDSKDIGIMENMENQAMQDEPKPAPEQEIPAMEISQKQGNRAIDMMQGVKPGISALELLQRVRMENTTIDAVQRNLAAEQRQAHLAANQAKSTMRSVPLETLVEDAMPKAGRQEAEEGQKLRTAAEAELNAGGTKTPDVLPAVQEEARKQAGGMPEAQPGMEAAAMPQPQVGMGAGAMPQPQVGMGAGAMPQPQVGVEAGAMPQPQPGMETAGAVPQPGMETEAMLGVQPGISDEGAMQKQQPQVPAAEAMQNRQPQMPAEVMPQIQPEMEAEAMLGVQPGMPAEAMPQMQPGMPAEAMPQMQPGMPAGAMPGMPAGVMPGMPAGSLPGQQIGNTSTDAFLNTQANIFSTDGNIGMGYQESSRIMDERMAILQSQGYPAGNEAIPAGAGSTGYDDSQERVSLAPKPKFRTQAQLQAEAAAMEKQKRFGDTEEFSEEDLAAAAQAAGFYGGTSQEYVQEDDKVKKLTPEQAQIFSYFVPISGMEVQIYDLLQGVSKHLLYDKDALTGNIIIEGISGSGKTVLIMDIIKVLQEEVRRPNGKIGKIDANALNQKDMDVLTEKVSGGCLIIESAGKISRETAVKLSRCMENDRAGTLYILEDTQQGIQKALERDSSFAAKFTEKISIPLFTTDELVAFGKAYANDLNYDIDEMGILALYKRIGGIQKLDHVITLTEVKEIVDEAIDNAEKGVLKKVFGILTATRANDDNYVILREKDFEE